MRGIKTSLLCVIASFTCPSQTQRSACQHPTASLFMLIVSCFHFLIRLTGLIILVVNLMYLNGPPGRSVSVNDWIYPQKQISATLTQRLKRSDPTWALTSRTEVCQSFIDSYLQIGEAGHAEARRFMVKVRKEKKNSWTAEERSWPRIMSQSPHYFWTIMWF